MKFNEAGEFPSPGKPGSQEDDGIPAALLPCPFCGEPPEIDNQRGKDSYRILCENRKCWMVAQTFWGSQADVSEAWNQRAKASDDRIRKCAVELFNRIESRGWQDAVSILPISEELRALREAVEASTTQHEGTKPSS